MQSLRCKNLKQHVFMRNGCVRPYSQKKTPYSFLPEYIRKKTPLLCAPSMTEEKRFYRACLTTGTLVILPLVYLWNDVGTTEFIEIIHFLPLLPIFFIVDFVIPAIGYFIYMILPGLSIVFVGGVVFFVAYVW